jgi:MFS family permease
MPRYINKNLGLDLKTVGLYTGICATFGGLLGTLLGGIGSDWFHARRKGGRMLFTSLGAVVCVVLWLVMLNTMWLPMILVPYFFLMGFALMWLGPAAADVQDVVGPQLRGLGVAVYFFIVNIIGYGLGPPLIGRLSDVFGVAQDPSQMRYALMVCPAACVVSALLLWRGSEAMRKA